mmetsp:Transcript_18614/g.53115  ORF Transcript_18614/g.53115 Transcript_18614/m.53115 type:complete len:241 (-) Transcript_18614:171-893(-)
MIVFRQLLTAATIWTILSSSNAFLIQNGATTTSNSKIAIAASDGSATKLAPYVANAKLTPATFQLAAGGNNNIFDDIRNFFDGNDGNNDNNGGNGSSNAEDDDDDIPAGTTRIATIPVKSIKPGGLRLFLMFYLMGQQNTPEQNSWRADQPISDDHVVEMYYHDASAMLTVELMETEIRIDRTGSMPSMQYLMQESVIVQGILDELQQCSSDDGVDEADRLLIPEPKDAIENAMESISFG